MDEIRSWWEVPAVAHYCSVFRKTFNLPDFEIEELEDALLSDRQDEDNTLLCYLVVDLLSGILGRTDLTTANMDEHLKGALSWQYEMKDGLEHPLGGENSTFMSLSPRTKIHIINKLCDYRMEALDVAQHTQDEDASKFRLEPLGEDSDGVKYWYFYGCRLYKEESPEQKSPTEDTRSTTKVKKRVGRPPKSDKTEQSFPDMRQPTTDDTIGAWSLAASSVDEWESLAAGLRKKGSSARDRKLAKLIENDFLPELPGLIATEEKARQKRLLSLVEGTRQSGRLEQKRKQRQMRQAAEEAARKAEEEARREAARLEAEREAERRALRLEQERAERLLQRKLIAEDRERRAALREQKARLLAEGRPLPPDLSGTESSDVTPAGSPLPSDGQAFCRKRPYSELLAEDEEGSTGAEQEDVHTGMFKVLKEMENHPDAWPFQWPVSEEIAPGYSEVIKDPICIEEMFVKLHRKEYPSKSAFCLEFHRMMDNCWVFNGRRSQYGIMATQVLRAFVKSVKFHLLFDYHVKTSSRGRTRGGGGSRGSSDSPLKESPDVSRTSTSSKKRKKTLETDLSNIFYDEDDSDVSESEYEHMIPPPKELVTRPQSSALKTPKLQDTKSFIHSSLNRLPERPLVDARMDLAADPCRNAARLPSIQRRYPGSTGNRPPAIRNVTLNSATPTRVHNYCPSILKNGANAAAANASVNIGNQTPEANKSKTERMGFQIFQQLNGTQQDSSPVSSASNMHSVSAKEACTSAIHFTSPGVASVKANVPAAAAATQSPHAVMRTPSQSPVHNTGLPPVLKINSNAAVRLIYASPVSQTSQMPPAHNPDSTNLSTVKKPLLMLLNNTNGGTKIALSPSSVRVTAPSKSQPMYLNIVPKNGDKKSNTFTFTPLNISGDGSHATALSGVRTPFSSSPLKKPRISSQGNPPRGRGRPKGTPNSDPNSRDNQSSPLKSTSSVSSHHSGNTPARDVSTTPAPDHIPRPDNDDTSQGSLPSTPLNSSLTVSDCSSFTADPSPEILPSQFNRPRETST